MKAITWQGRRHVEGGTRRLPEGCAEAMTQDHERTGGPPVAIVAGGSPLLELLTAQGEKAAEANNARTIRTASIG